MKDTGLAIRNAYYNLLNGNLTYNSKNVPVYKDDPIATPPDNYVVITEVIEGQDNNNQKFVNELQVTLDITTKQYKTIDRSICENIANQIVNLVKPTTSTQGIDTTDFQVMNVNRGSGTYLNELDGDYHIVRKILIFNQTLIEK